MQEFPTGTCSIVCIIDTLSGAAGKYFLFQMGTGGSSPGLCVFVVSAGGNFGFYLPARVRADIPSWHGRRSLLHQGMCKYISVRCRRTGEFGVLPLSPTCVPILTSVPEGLAAWPVRCGRDCWLRVSPQKKRDLCISRARNNNTVKLNFECNLPKCR